MTPVTSVYHDVAISSDWSMCNIKDARIMWVPEFMRIGPHYYLSQFVKVDHQGKSKKLV